MTASDISDLPPEVLKELRLKQPDNLETKIIAIVNAAPDSVDIDAIIIALWRMHKIHESRKYLMNKLYRMSNAGMIAREPRLKGVYRRTKGTP